MSVADPRLKASVSRGPIAVVEALGSFAHGARFFVEFVTGSSSPGWPRVVEDGQPVAKRDKRLVFFRRTRIWLGSNAP